VEILETVILFTALTSIIVVSFSAAAGFALYQAVASETKYAVAVMTQLGEGVQSIAEGREAAVDIQFNYRYGALAYVNDTAISVELIDQQGHTITAYASSQYGRFEYVTPYTVYGSAPVQDKGNELAACVTSINDAVAVYHYSENGRTYALVQPQPVVNWQVNADGTVDVQILLVELAASASLLTRQGPLRLVYDATTHLNYAAITGPVKVHVTLGQNSRELSIGTGGSTVNVYVTIVKVVS
jgi:hypothetical protein